METVRLSARPLTLEDAGTVFALTSDPTVAEFMRFDTHHTLSEAEELIRELTTGGNQGFLVSERVGGEAAGVFAFKRDGEGEPGAYSITTFLSPACWNRGYSTEFLAMAVDYARTVLSASCLRAYIVAANAASCRVCEKNGFHLVRTLQFDDLPCGLRIYERTWNE